MLFSRVNRYYGHVAVGTFVLYENKKYDIEVFDWNLSFLNNAFHKQTYFKELAYIVYGKCF